MKTWDTEKARQLLEAGGSNTEVAAAVGVPVSTLNSWKRRNGLAKPRASQSKPESVPEAAPEPEPEPEMEWDPESVQMNIHMMGCHLYINAPDIARAAALLKTLSDITKTN